jgi:hypothetical protein|tara:strand:- start:273 stop:410 length:138 start_codon:yes stop_codon:yes gene_type:complete
MQSKIFWPLNLDGSEDGAITGLQAPERFAEKLSHSQPSAMQEFPL